MDNLKYKKFIHILRSAYKIRGGEFIFSKMLELNKPDSNNEESIFFHEFEFSLAEKKSSIRILHLEFYQAGLKYGEIHNLLKAREDKIFYLFDVFSNRLSFHYDKKVCLKFFDLNRKNNGWPVQVGVEFDGEIKGKIYLSVNNDQFPMEKFCSAFNLNYEKISRSLGNKNLDAVGIDLFADGKYNVKIYPSENSGQGWLWRLSEQSGIVSRKKWTRFSGGLILNKNILDLIDLPEAVKNAIIKYRLKISYFCSEKGIKSIYVR